MQGLALSWLVYRLTGSAAALGIVIFAGNLPLLFLLFIGGIAADRYDKRKILLVCNTVAIKIAAAKRTRRRLNRHAVR